MVVVRCQLHALRIRSEKRCGPFHNCRTACHELWLHQWDVPRPLWGGVGHQISMTVFLNYSGESKANSIQEMCEIRYLDNMNHKLHQVSVSISWPPGSNREIWIATLPGFDSDGNLDLGVRSPHITYIATGNSSCCHVCWSFSGAMSMV